MFSICVKKVNFNGYDMCTVRSVNNKLTNFTLFSPSPKPSSYSLLRWRRCLKGG
jgi:hypothetical protein